MDVQEGGGPDLQHRGLRDEQAHRVVLGLQQRRDICSGDMQHQQQHLLQAQSTHSLLQYNHLCKNNLDQPFEHCFKLIQIRSLIM